MLGQAKPSTNSCVRRGLRSRSFVPQQLRVDASLFSLSANVPTVICFASSCYFQMLAWLRSAGKPKTDWSASVFHLSLRQLLRPPVAIDARLLNHGVAPLPVSNRLQLRCGESAFAITNARAEGYVNSRLPGEAGLRGTN